MSYQPRASSYGFSVAELKALESPTRLRWAAEFFARQASVPLYAP